MTNDQLKSLHSTAGRLTKLTGGEFGRPHYDQILVDEGHVRKLPPSSKNLDERGFERVMAAMETLLAKYDPETSMRWRTIVARRRAGLTSDQQLHELTTLQRQLADLGGPTYGLDALAHRFSNHRVKRIDDLRDFEASMVIEMLKAAIARQPQPTEVSKCR